MENCAINWLMNDLVELSKISPRILLDIRYATPNNFTGKAVYPSARCFLLREAADRLHRVQLNLEKMGLGLKVYDGYRPLAVQKIFWALVPDPRYVADPAEGSKHNRGASVDLTLVGPDGQELLMPTEFDDFTEKAGHGYMGGPEEALLNRNILRSAMEAEGFIPYEGEWWHYDDPDWKNFPILDISIPS
jgi:D-alanyl-D-alanine dipeptidase